MSVADRTARVHARLYPSGDLQLEIKGTKKKKSAGGDPKLAKVARSTRGVISALSPKSARRCLTTFRALAHRFQTVITLTYPIEYLGLLDGRESKAHLRRFLYWLTTTKRVVHYAWILEFQNNGNPHYHVMIDQDIPKEEVAKKWYKIVGSGLEKHFLAGTRIERIRSQIASADYMARYLSKIDQKQVPEGFRQVGRFWGIPRGILEPVVDVELGYDDPGDALRSTREIRKARKASLRRFGIKWRWGGRGFVDRSMGPGLTRVLVDRLVSRADDAESNLVPWQIEP